MNKKKTIDAENKSLGRVATQIATALMGKDQVDFQKHILADVSVEVINASKIKLTGKKLDQKIYYHHSGYPSGLKEEKAGKLIDRLGAEALIKKAVQRMLPDNKLRPQMMKKLIINK